MKRIILLLIVMALTLSVFSGCASEKEEISVYFKEIQSNNLSSEKRSMEIKGSVNEEDKAKFAVMELIKGPRKETNAGVISKEAKLLSLAVNEGVATVNLSSHYSEKTDVDELLLRLAIVNTICSIDGITGVVIQVEGVPIVSEVTGKEIGVISINDIADEQLTEKTAIALYFPDSDANKLRVEKRTVEIQKALSLEKAVVTELIKGPVSKELTASVPEGTKLLGIETKDNICFVNFSGEFISKSNSGSLATMLTLYSVVNSLCELDSVESVQILINGETGVEFGNIVLDIPYEANEDLK